jgi:hypothetical protein
LHTSPRTATGSGVSSEVGYIPSTGASARTATGSGVGSATTVSSFFSYIYADGSSSGTGSSTASTTHNKVRTATGSGIGSSSASSLLKSLRSASGSGLGSSATSRVLTSFRTATGSGVGGQTVQSGKYFERSALGSGESTQTNLAWSKSHIFRIPDTYLYPGGQRRETNSANRLQRYNRTNVRVRNLYKLTNGEYTTIDQRDQGQVVKVWQGGHEHFLSDAEVVELTAAGFGASIT